jgi:hypothetical protein
MQAKNMSKYTFHAKAVAAHFRFTDGNRDFGDEFTVLLRSEAPHEHHQDTGARTGPEVTFTHSFVHVSFQKEPGGVFTTVARAGVRNLNVRNRVTADALECGVMTVYREAWYGDPARPRRARILPLPPVIENLTVSGMPYRVGQELQLPDAFAFDDARRARYFRGEEPEIEPQAISSAPGRPLKTDRGEIDISADTRRITIPNFGIVDFADWMWLPADTDIAERTAQWVQLIRYELGNPGNGSIAGVGGNGSPSGK